MPWTINPLLQSIVQAAVQATDAEQGWLVAERGDALRIVAAAGGTAGDLLGAEVPLDSETVGLVFASGSPVSLKPTAGEGSLRGEQQLLGRRPGAVLAVPCVSDEGVVGAIELIDKHGGDAFPLSELELVTALATVAAVALTDGAGAAEVPQPGTLGDGLAELARADPARYALVAPVVATLIGRG